MQQGTYERLITILLVQSLSSSHTIDIGFLNAHKSSYPFTSFVFVDWAVNVSVHGASSHQAMVSFGLTPVDIIDTLDNYLVLCLPNPWGH